MSDLDDFFAKRLEDEASFSNRSKNWKQMSQRLDAFDAGAVQGPNPRLRAWQIATFAALVTVGLLVWKTVRSTQENHVLRQDIAAIQLEQTHLAEQLAAAELRLAAPQARATPLAAPAIHSGGADDQIIIKRSEISRVQQRVITLPSRQERSTPPQKESEMTLVPVQDVHKTPANDPLSKGIFSPEIPAPVNNPAVQAPLSSDTSSVSEIAAVPTLKDTLSNTRVRVDSALVSVEKSKDSILSNRSLSLDIKPQPTRKDHFRMGAHATLGFVQPREKGVSALRGQGLTMEARLIKSLWVSASVDWLHHEVSTEKFVPRFHPPHDSLPEPPNTGGGGGPHQPKLVLVESTPREQHFALGLRYTLPVKFWVRPSIRVAHEWTHISPTLVTYKFEEEDPGGPWHDHDPEYTAEKFDALWLKNQWRFGVGIEKDIPQWTFGLWADYSKDFSASTPSYDALYVRAGAQFRF